MVRPVLKTAPVLMKIQRVAQKLMVSVNVCLAGLAPTVVKTLTNVTTSQTLALEPATLNVSTPMAHTTVYVK